MCTGGHLFEWWLDEFSSWKVNKAWKAILRERRRATLDEVVEMVEVEGGPFLQHTWTTLGNIGHDAMLQKHFFTFLLLYKGASKSGLVLTAALGLTSPWTQFALWRKQQYALAEQQGL